MKKKTTQYIDLVPLGKCRRILVFLADFFIAFILGLGFFSLACYPISKTFPSVKEANRIEREGQEEKRNLLFDNGLLSKAEERKIDDTSSIREYSSTLFLKGQLSDKSNDYFSNYYIGIRKRSRKELLDIYAHTSSNVFFETDGDTLKRKDKYREEFLPLLDSKDERTEGGKSDLSYFKNSFFATRYGNRLKDREDTSHQGEFFTLFQNAAKKRKQGEKSFSRSIVISTYVSFIISSLVLFLIVPLILPRGKTLGRMARKIDRVNRTGFTVLSRLKRCYVFILNTLFSLGYLVFLPCFYVSFTQLFSFSSLFFSIGGIILDILSLIFLVFNGFNRCFTDWLSSSVLINSSDYEHLPNSRK